MASSFRVRAVNTAADSENRIHDDQVAAQYGFRGGLVPGVTVYGYLAAAAIQHFGLEWMRHGAMDVRFSQPIYEGEEVAITPVEQPDGKLALEADQRAFGTAWIQVAEGPPLGQEYSPLVTEPQIPSRGTIRTGVSLGAFERVLNLAEPGMAAPLDAWVGPYRDAHPAILLALANEIVVRNYCLGPWIHVASEVRNYGTARDGEPVRVSAKIVNTYERKGHEFLVADVSLVNNGRLICQVKHTAIWQPRKV